MESKVKCGRLPIFKERLIGLRGRLSNTEFADFLGLSRQTVGFYLNGDRLPDSISLRVIAQKCNVSTDYLLGLSDVASADVNIKAICESTGLSEEAVSVLEFYSDENVWIDFLDFISFLIEQETPSPFDVSNDPADIGSEEEEKWKNENYISLFNKIFDFFEIGETAQKIRITDSGEIIVDSQESGFRKDVLSTKERVSTNDVVHQVLINRIQDRIFKLKEKYIASGRCKQCRTFVK